MTKQFMFPRINQNAEPIFGVPNIKKIVFLDIDNVIESGNVDDKIDHDLKATASYLALKYHDDIYNRMRDNDIGASFYNWDDLAIGRLKKLLYETGSEVVIHSDYRIDTNLEEFKALFRIHGMDDYIIDKCGNYDSKIEAIKKYLENYKQIIENYIIFDDDDELAVFNNHFILVKDLLSYTNIKEAEKILEKVL